MPAKVRRSEDATPNGGTLVSPFRTLVKPLSISNTATPSQFPVKVSIRLSEQLVHNENISRTTKITWVQYILY